MDVNLKGVIYTARIGAHYLRKNGKHTSCALESYKANFFAGGNGKGGDLVLVSSIAGFKESTGLGIYTASKHGVLGILRGTRVQLERDGVRCNAVCPWMTSTSSLFPITFPSPIHSEIEVGGWELLTRKRNSNGSRYRSRLAQPRFTGK